LDSLIKKDTNISSIKKYLSSLNESYEDLYMGKGPVQFDIPKTIEEYKKNLVEKAYSLNSAFAGCSSLVNIPDISKWNIQKTKDISCLFRGCTS
jgi:surface protein